MNEPTIYSLHRAISVKDAQREQTQQENTTRQIRQKQAIVLLIDK